jgi:2-keto-3-deoxy-L-arabinonate dehydratase
MSQLDVSARRLHLHVDDLALQQRHAAWKPPAGGGYPDDIRQIVDPYLARQREEAVAAYARWLPLINHENRQCGLQACNILMKEGGVIGSEAVRHPLQEVHPETRAGLFEIARQLDPVLRWCH